MLTVAAAAAVALSAAEAIHSLQQGYKHASNSFAGLMSLSPQQSDARMAVPSGLIATMDTDYYACISHDAPSSDLLQYGPAELTAAAGARQLSWCLHGTQAAICLQRLFVCLKLS